MLLNDKLYVRSSEYRPSPFKIFDKHTLKPTPDRERYAPVKSDSRTIKWEKYTSKTERYLGNTPLMTDGNLVYVIAIRPARKDHPS